MPEVDASCPGRSHPDPGRAVKNPAAFERANDMRTFRSWVAPPEVTQATADRPGGLARPDLGAFGPRHPSRRLTTAVARAALGRNGGYRLGRPASQISLLDVITAIESQPIERRCVLRGGPCLPDGSCVVHAAFTAARNRFVEELATRSLESVLASPGWQPTAGARADG